MPQYPDVVVPQIVAQLQAVGASIEAAAADVAASGGEAGTPPAAAGTSTAAAAAQWGLLLSYAMAELSQVLSLLSLHVDHKAHISEAFSAVLQQLLAARRAEQHPMLAAFRAALASGQQSLR